MADLSPAAQAVLDAADSAFEQAGTTRQGITAALRAAVEQQRDLAFDVGSAFVPSVEVAADFLETLAAELDPTQCPAPRHSR
jgi:hypothetical protein